MVGEAKNYFCDRTNTKVTWATANDKKGKKNKKKV